MIEYRKAGLDDSESLAKIRSVFIMETGGKVSEKDRETMEDANRAYLETALADGSFVAWLALDNCRIVATSGVCFSFMPPSLKCPNGRTANISSMFTISEYRKRGIASELFRRVLDEAIGRDCKRVTLIATEMGRPLYEKFGFTDAEGSMAYYVR